MLEQHGLARHARLDSLDWLDKVERVESSRAKWNLGLKGSSPQY